MLFQILIYVTENVEIVVMETTWTGDLIVNSAWKVKSAGLRPQKRTTLN